MSDFIRRNKKYSDKPIVRIDAKRETVAEALARGAVIEKVPRGASNLDPLTGAPKKISEDRRRAAHNSAMKRRRP